MRKISVLVVLILVVNFSIVPISSSSISKSCVSSPCEHSCNISNEENCCSTQHEDELNCNKEVCDCNNQDICCNHGDDNYSCNNEFESSSALNVNAEYKCINKVCKHYLLKYPSSQWYEITWEYDINQPYDLLLDSFGFTMEDADLIINSNYNQDIVNNLISQNNYFGHNPTYFYDGSTMSLNAMLRNYWNDIPIPETMAEERNLIRSDSSQFYQKQSDGLAFTPKSQLTTLTADLEYSLATMLKDAIFQAPGSKFTGGWKHVDCNGVLGRVGHEGVDIALGGKETAHPYYSVSIGYVIRADRKEDSSEGTSWGIVTINNKDTTKHIYAHSQAINVTLHEVIRYGRELGIQGGRGMRDGISDPDAFAKHVHFEIHNNSQYNGMFEYGYNGAISPYLAIQNIADNSETMNPCPHQDIDSDDSCDICGHRHQYIIVSKDDNKHIFKCSCGTESISDHSKKETITLAPTCIKKGTMSINCENSLCDYSSKKDIPIDSTAHSWSKWETVVQAYCSTKGSEKRTCNLCNKLETRNTDYDQSKHKTSSAWTVTKAATCSVSGEQVTKCTACKAITNTKEISPIAHSFLSWNITRAAKCSATGEKTRLCKTCSYTEVSSIPKTSHSFNSWYIATNPTCVSSGIQVRACKSCFESEVSILPITSHPYSSWVTTRIATCSETGEKIRTCNYCSRKETSSISKTSHTFSSWYIAKNATCTATGYKTRSCNKCKYFEDAIIPLASHTSYSTGSWVKVSSSSTCRSRPVKCKCGKVIQTEIDTTHTYSTSKYCSDCGYCKK